jgi:2-polyprenyl-6-methoxyphenol hydroxylase-like FAD-dependent oxidoreductase
MAGTPARSAVVVGAGVGGLATAGALARTGWRVTLLERADRLRAVPTALLLWPAGVRALRVLGVGAGLDAISTALPDHGVRRPDGRWLVQPDRGTDAQPVLVHAEDLHDALVAGLGDRLEILTGTDVRRAVVSAPMPSGATDRAAVTDGKRTWAGDLIVAADGIDSTLRTAVDPRGRVVSAGASTWRAVVPWYRAPSLPAEHAVGGHTYGDGYRFFSAPLGQRGATGPASRGGLFWRATVSGAARPEPAATQLNLLRRWFDGWHAPIGELLAATEPADLVQRELRTLHPPPQRYAVARGDGALVLLGDAGHAMAEHLGQGACLALEDAATLVTSVREAAPGAPLHTAVGAYQSTRRARVAEVRRRSGRLGATGPLARLGSVQARRRDRAAAAASTWTLPAR